MFKTGIDQIKYIKDTYPEVTDNRINESHWDLNCSRCKTVRGFQVVSCSVNEKYDEMYRRYFIDNKAPLAIYFRCPVCMAYKQWILYKITQKEGDEKDKKDVTRYYRVASLPSEGIEDMEEIPLDPPELRIAYKQAVRAMDANAHIAAAAMFRRALQIITRNILGAKPGNLANELKEVVGKKYNGVTITKDFGDIGYTLKEAGNQGAHPDADPDLLDFTAEDAEDLQRIFMEIIGDLFIFPEVAKKAKEDFLKRRKINTVS